MCSKSKEGNIIRLFVEKAWEKKRTKSKFLVTVNLVEKATSELDISYRYSKTYRTDNAPKQRGQEHYLLSLFISRLHFPLEGMRTLPVLSSTTGCGLLGSDRYLLHLQMLSKISAERQIRHFDSRVVKSDSKNCHCWFVCKNGYAKITKANLSVRFVSRMTQK